MLAQLQNHWEGHRNEHQHSKKICTDTGRPGAHHYRANQCHHEGRSKAKRKSSLHRPSDPGSSGAILSAAVGEYIPGCTEGESIRYESQAGTPCVTGCARLCEVFPVGVGNRYLIPSRPLFEPILRQLEKAHSIAAQKTKRLS